MDNDDAVMAILAGALTAEERIVPIYTKHLGSALFWTGIDEAKARKAQEILARLARESEAHSVIVRNLLARLGKGGA